MKKTDNTLLNEGKEGRKKKFFLNKKKNEEDVTEEFIESRAIKNIYIAHTARMCHKVNFATRQLISITLRSLMLMVMIMMMMMLLERFYFFFLLYTFHTTEQRMEKFICKLNARKL